MLFQKMLTLYLSTLFLAPAIAEAQKAKDDGVDNVLERLEQQIMSDEADGLSHLKSEKGPFGMSDEQNPGYAQPVKSAKKPREPNQDFSQIHAQIKVLEQEIDALSSDVQQYKQAAVVSSKDNSYVYLEATLLDSSKNNLKSIRVKVDGFTVYHVRDTAGLWLPDSAIPLYSGPLSAGTHRLEIEANVSEIQSPGLPVSGPTFKSVEKTFEIQIPLGSTNKKYQLGIATGSDQKSAPTVTLKDSL